MTTKRDIERKLDGLEEADQPDDSGVVIEFREEIVATPWEPDPDPDADRDPPAPDVSTTVVEL